MLLAILAIWLEMVLLISFLPGQTRFRWNVFKILKFRSMTLLKNGADIPQAQRQDPRITRVGYFLRRTSIDEASAAVQRPERRCRRK